MAGAWSQSGYEQSWWDDSWQTAPRKGKGKKGTKKGSSKPGKGKTEWEADAAQAETWQAAGAAGTEHVGRILSRYQLPHKLLRTAADSEGSAFVKDKAKMNDFAFLTARNLKKLVTNQNHHLLRRPGVGISEAAGTLQAGANTLENMKDLTVESVTALLADNDVKEALTTLNTMDTTAARDAAAIAEAIETVQKAIGKSKELEEAAIKMTIMASRLYLLGVHLLPLRAGLLDPEWWAEQVPESLSTNRKFQAWKASPSDKSKMQRALAALMVEKIEESSGAGANDAGALFGRSIAADAAESSSESSAKAARKTKKDKKHKKKKAASSSGDTASATAKKEKKTNKKAKEAKEAKEAKDKKAKKRSSSPSQGSTSSKAAAKAAEKKRKPKAKAESVTSSPEFVEAPKVKKAKKEKDGKGESKKPEKPEDRSTVKVRRVSGMTPDGRIIVKEEDRYDEIDVKSSEWTLQELLKELLTASGDGEDLNNWTVKVLEDGKCKPVAIDTTPAALHPEVVLVRKGG